MASDRNLHKNMDTLFPQTSSDRCRVCDEEVVDGRWNYCSERCREIAKAVHRMFSWDAIREQILERDDYTCQKCGLDKERWERAHWQVREIAKERAQHLRDEGRLDEWRRRRRRIENRYGIEWPSFHVDHIERIADGGHPFDETNLQTLCEHCHKQKTAEENSGRGGPKPDVTLEDYMDS